MLLLLIRNLARSSPVTIYVSGLLSSLVTGQPLPALVSVLNFVFGDLLNLILKTILMWLRPDHPLWQRPAPPEDCCGPFPNVELDMTKNFGMPSAHAQVISFAAVFWILYIWRQSSYTPLYAFIATLTVILLAGLILWSRVKEGCHNNLQVGVGSVIGTVLGALNYLVILKRYPQLLGVSTEMTGGGLASIISEDDLAPSVIEGATSSVPL